MTATTDFATTGASTSTIAMNTDQTGNIPVGSAIRFTLDGTVYYAQVSALTSNLMTIRGAPLDTTAGHLTALAYSTLPSMVDELAWPFNGAFADDADTALLTNDLRMPIVWTRGPAYVVGIDVICRVDDSGANQPRLNVRIGATTTDYVSTSNSNAGLAVAETWQKTVVDIATAKYALTNGVAVEVKVDANGSNKDAVDAVVIVTVVFQ